MQNEQHKIWHQVQRWLEIKPLPQMDCYVNDGFLDRMARHYSPTGFIHAIRSLPRVTCVIEESALPPLHPLRFIQTADRSDNNPLAMCPEQRTHEPHGIHCAVVYDRSEKNVTEKEF